MAVRTALTVAGSDPGGGAGLQADLKTFYDHGVYGTSAVTALTIQDTRGVRAVHPVAPEVVAAQIAVVLGDFDVHAVKLGMLADAAVIHAVEVALRGWRGPLVLDPVLRAKDGTALVDPDALAALRRLAARATLVTPNRDEAPILGPIPVPTLVKGGHAEGAVVVDELHVDGRVHRFAHARHPARHTHGTGCTLASAIAARLALGEPLVDAVGGSIAYVAGLVARGTTGIGHGNGPLLRGRERG